MFSQIIFAYHGVDMPTPRVECEKPQENRIRGALRGSSVGRVLSVVSSLKSHKGKVQTFCALYHLFPFPCYGNCKYFVTPAITVSVGVSPQVSPPSLLPLSRTSHTFCSRINLLWSLGTNETRDLPNCLWLPSLLCSPSLSSSVSHSVYTLN